MVKTSNSRCCLNKSIRKLKSLKKKVVKKEKAKNLVRKIVSLNLDYTTI